MPPEDLFSRLASSAGRDQMPPQGLGATKCQWTTLTTGDLSTARRVISDAVVRLCQGEREPTNGLP